jgi:hypothetical protein
VNFLKANESANSAVSIFVELIKSGRYANPDVGIDDALNELSKIKKSYEELRNRESEQ